MRRWHRRLAHGAVAGAGGDHPGADVSGGLLGRRPADRRPRGPAASAVGQLVEPGHLERTARSAVGRVHRLHRPHADARIRTSARHPTAFRTSSVGGVAAARAGDVRGLRQRERRRDSAARRLSDSRRGANAAELHRRRRAGRRLGRRSPPARSSIAIAGCCTSCSRRAGTRRAGAGRPAPARSSICRRTPGAPRDGRPPTPPAWRSCRVSCATTKRCAARSGMRSASRCGATNGYVWPASHRAGSNAGALPMGARLRLKASKNLSGYPVVHPEHLPRHADLRPHRRGQRQRHVRHRRDGLPRGTTTS